MIDHTGHVYGYLTVLGLTDAPSWVKPKRLFWRCRCICGKEMTAWAGSLASGNTTSCGCMCIAGRRERATKHGLRYTAEHRTWVHMIDRCLNPRNKDFRHYGGRGITVCDRWRDSVTVFYADMGPRPTTKHTIERRDNNGPYAPDNCYWATRLEQARNRRRPHQSPTRLQSRH